MTGLLKFVLNIVGLLGLLAILLGIAMLVTGITMQPVLTLAILVIGCGLIMCATSVVFGEVLLDSNKPLEYRLIAGGIFCLIIGLVFILYGALNMDTILQIKEILDL